MLWRGKSGVLFKRNRTLEVLEQSLAAKMWFCAALHRRVKLMWTRVVIHHYGDVQQKPAIRVCLKASPNF
jgi:hypothetical protein